MRPCCASQLPCQATPEQQMEHADRPQTWGQQRPALHRLGQSALLPDPHAWLQSSLSRPGSTPSTQGSTSMSLSTADASPQLLRPAARTAQPSKGAQTAPWGSLHGPPSQPHLTLPLHAGLLGPQPFRSLKRGQLRAQLPSNSPPPEHRPSPAGSRLGGPALLPVPAPADTSRHRPGQAAAAAAAAAAVAAARRVQPQQQVQGIDQQQQQQQGGLGGRYGSDSSSPGSDVRPGSQGLFRPSGPMIYKSRHEKFMGSMRAQGEQ